MTTDLNNGVVGTVGTSDQLITVDHASTTQNSAPEFSPVAPRAKQTPAEKAEKAFSALCDELLREQVKEARAESAALKRDARRGVLARTYGAYLISTGTAKAEAIKAIDKRLTDSGVNAPNVSRLLKTAAVLECLPGTEALTYTFVRDAALPTLIKLNKNTLLGEIDQGILDEYHAIILPMIRDGKGAADVIKRVKAMKAGNAKFLPPDEVKRREDADKLAKSAATIGKAIRSGGKSALAALVANDPALLALIKETIKGM